MVRRANTWQEAYDSGTAMLDLGDGIKIPLPLSGLVPAWRPNTPYTTGQRVIAPSGDIVSSKANFTSGAAYAAADWNASTQQGEIAAAVYYQGGLLSTAPVNDPLGSLKDGVHRVTSDARAAELSLPDSRAGRLIQLSSGTFGIHFYESLLGQSIRLWSSGTNTWGTWTKPANTYTDTAMNSVKWYQGGLTATAPINEALGALVDGDYRVTQDVTAAALGLPDGRAGNFKQLSFGTFGFHSHTTLLGTSVRLWSSTSTAWGAWTKPESGGAASSGMKLVPLVLTAGHGGTAYAQTTATVRYPMWWGAPISRFRVHIRNINPRENAVRTGAVSFPQGLYVGTAAAWDGTLAAPTQIAGAFSTPENGDDWVSGWVEKELPADSKHLLSGAYVASNTVMNNAGACWTSPTEAANSTAGAWTQGSMAPFDVWIEAETPSMTPTVAVVGDSLSAGTSSSLPVLDSVLSQYMRSWGGLPIHYAHVGDSFNSYNGGGAAGSADYKKNRWLHLAAPDSVLIPLGSNDIFGNSAPLSTMQSRCTTFVAWAKANISSTVFLSTITPRDLETGAKEDVRRQYNLWLKEQTTPNGLARAVFDFAAAISLDDETIRPEFNGDGIHLNTAGYAAEAAVLRNLTSPAVMYRTI
ncbi:SGNH/GDSL hydrolase family protein [Pseudarthrobacter sp. J64]|uniref:SGNH/GDSL hydrolase family protein n=1 Tax=Pseudarthrobacter sp. J64 TaxID=3116485 RepID=UPI002E80E065|nr:SGNH/GDSL hydrolase family protein [Pseudarthrobacter sp. J64]MEE2568612.1 SGNH/GDSL hydrolase family protein [Pseudarthrobacter sp. J64]